MVRLTSSDHVRRDLRPLHSRRSMPRVADVESILPYFVNTWIIVTPVMDLYRALGKLRLLRML